MMNGFIASRPAGTSWLGGTTVSAVTHGAVVALLVTSGATTISAVHEERAAAPVERVTYVRPALMSIPEAKAKRDADGTSRMHARAVTSNATPSDLSIQPRDVAVSIQIDVPDLTVEPDLTAVVAASIHDGDYGKIAPSLAALVAVNAAFTRPASGIYTEDLVDRSIVPREGNPKPRYPSALADRGIGGEFMVRFVVDSTGRVPADKIEFPSAMHQLFAAAVRTALLKSRYTPAVVAGRFVSEQVRQEFRFTMGDRRR